MTKRPISDVRQWMEQSSAAAIDRLIRWCDQNSWSLDEDNLRIMASMLQDDFAQFGIEFQSLELPKLRLLGDEEEWDRQSTGPALLWHHNATAARRLLLMIHYDTVYPRDAIPAQCQRLAENRLLGPGTADAKGGIAVIAMAVEAVLKFGLASDLGLSILLNPDEEIGSTATMSVMQELAPQFDAALLFEPTLPNESLVAARKGSGNFAYVVRGKSAHAGRNPDAGRNAVVHLAKLVTEVAKLHDSTHGILLNVGRIGGGGPLNRVPDHAVAQFNVRAANPSLVERIKTDLSEIAERFSDGDYRVTLQGEFHCPPKLVDQASQQLQQVVAAAGSTAGRSIVWQDTGGACDGSKLAAMGLTNVDTLGVNGGALHSPKEFCDLDSLVPAAHTVAAIIENF